MVSLFEDYFSYTGYSEVPQIFHRWAFVSLIGALLGRQVVFPLGHYEIYPNQYIILTGPPGARKGGAIKPAKRLLKRLGYPYISPNKGAKEALWKWMAKQLNTVEDDEDLIDSVIDPNIKDKITYAYIAHDELVDFLGSNDDGMMTNLTNLWDNLDEYEHEKTRSRSIFVPNPTVNILSGITPMGIADHFKGMAIGGGFFSRIIFVFSNPSEHKVTFPEAPNTEIESKIVDRLSEVKELKGTLKLDLKVSRFLDRIYNNTPDVIDPRFTYYHQRRFTHLLKIITCISAMDLTLQPTIEHCLLANTILAAAEIKMPHALGEFGKSRHADIANKIIEMVKHSSTPVPAREIWKQVARDLDKHSTLNDILVNLTTSERIQKITVNKMPAYIPNNTIKTSWKSDLVDFSLLATEENDGELYEHALSPIGRS